MWIVIDKDRYRREISSSGRDDSLRFLRRVTARLLVSNQDNIGITNALNVDRRRVLKLRGVKHEHHDVVVATLS
jgi:hypothetical protein